MLVEAPSRTASTDELEALIREAREHQRRRRWRIGLLLFVVVAVGTVAYALARSLGGGAPRVERILHGPVVNVGAFSGHGRLAFVSGSRLWLLDGTTGRLHRLPTPGGFTPSQPVFSFDGKWLAYLEQHVGPATGDDYARLWIARADGSDSHLVSGMKVYSLIGWSPSTDLLAVAAGPERTTQPCPCYSPTTLRVVSPNGAHRTVAHTSWLYGGSWSPDGSKLAVAADRYPLATLVVYPVSGGRGETWLQVNSHQRLNEMRGALFDLAGWWPRLGVGFWVFGDGAVHNLDNTPLDLVSSPGARPRLLGQTLSDGVTDAVAASSSGDVAIVTDHGGGRAAWQDKTVKVCSSGARGCRPLPHARGEVTVDPSWAPDGKTLAYVEAPNVRSGPWSQQAIAAWFAAHRVLLYDTSSDHVRALPSARGATAISWSRNGQSLIYVRDDGLWLLPSLNSKPVRIASPLFASRNWPQYYTQVAWASQFAWAAP